MSAAGEPETVPLKQVLARWDALVVRWEITGEECSSLLGGAAEGPVNDISTYTLPTVENRMRLIVELEPILDRVLGDEERIRDWLRRSNCNLGGSAPLQVMSRSPAWIRWLIDAVGIVA